MRGGGDRRTVLRWAGAVALAPILATHVLAVAPAPAGRFDPPAGPMRHTRRLERSLPDGKTLVVERGFAVRFAPAPGGWSVAGEQVDVAVEAPKWIAAYADLERRRIETGAFPLSLDRGGLIVGVAEPQPSKEFDEAVALAMRTLDEADFAADERKRLEVFVHAVHEAGARMSSEPPADLFAPRDGDSRAERALALPGGEEGTIFIHFTASVDPATGLMREARREIVTAIAADRRLTREDWTLGPL